MYSLLMASDFKRETERQIQRAKSRGWSAEQRKSGHWVLRWPGGGMQIVTSKTPSDWRAVRNFKAQLARIESQYPINRESEDG